MHALWIEKKIISLPLIHRFFLHLHNKSNCFYDSNNMSFSKINSVKNENNIITVTTGLRSSLSLRSAILVVLVTMLIFLAKVSFPTYFSLFCRYRTPLLAASAAISDQLNVYSDLQTCRFKIKKK